MEIAYFYKTHIHNKRAFYSFKTYHRSVPVRVIPSTRFIRDNGSSNNFRLCAHARSPDAHGNIFGDCPKENFQFLAHEPTSDPVSSCQIEWYERQILL